MTTENNHTNNNPPTEKNNAVEIPPALAHCVNVRYGYLQIQEYFATDLADLKFGEAVVMKSPRGTDHGIVCSVVMTRCPRLNIVGNLLRRMTNGDRNVLQHIESRRLCEEKKFCVERIRERNLPMKVIATEHLLGGDKIIFYFTADGRVDFRELVKDLARRYRTRIEMRQIGVRDEARILSDYEHCGRELCCRTFLRDLETVTMRMAKTQKSTLDPSKISGHCGRLMCCLRFEDATYQEHQQAMPRPGQIIKTANVSGKVLNHDLMGNIEIEKDDGTRVKINHDEVV